MQLVGFLDRKYGFSGVRQSYGYKKALHKLGRAWESED
jgi:hypothetical protein